MEKKQQTLKKATQNTLKFIFFLSIGLVILYFVYQNANESYLEQCEIDGIPLEECSLVQKLIDDFKNLHVFWIMGMLAAFTFSHFIRALRWNMLLKPLGREARTVNSFLTIMLGYFANLGLPRLGEVLRPVTMARYEKVPLEKILGTIVVDRAMDFLSLFIMIGIAFLLEFDTLWGYLSKNMAVGGGGSSSFTYWFGGIGILGLAFFYFFRESIKNSGFYKKIAHILKGLWDGITSIRHLENPGLFILYSILIWVAYYFAFYMFLPAFPPTAHLGFLAALIIFVFSVFGIVIPSPGGMGSYHVLVIAGLALYGVTGSDAFSFANFAFFTPHLLNIVLGLVAVIFLPIINRNYQPQPIE